LRARLQPAAKGAAEEAGRHLLRRPGGQPGTGRRPAGGWPAHRPGARAAAIPVILDRLPAYKVLSLGLVNGRNVWRCDLEKALEILHHAHERLGNRLWVAPSCSLLHSPVDLEREDQLDAELKSWLAFAVQKCNEVA